MEAQVRTILERQFETPVRRVLPLGGGFYGRAFLAEIDKDPHILVLKLYLFPNLAAQEALQLKTLARHATVKMPTIYFVREATDVGERDALAMEYLPGLNAGKLADLAGLPVETLAEEMINNLAAYHDTVHAAGFGPLDAEAFVPDWRMHYEPIARNIGQKARSLFEAGQLGRDVLFVMDKALESFDSIFAQPIQKACLVHGDYNTWNVLLTENGAHVRAVIDPFNCCWADPEFDLYQLDNANGKAFGLLERYRQRRRLSETFDLKRDFYELFTEINHYYDAKISLGKSGVPGQARALAQRMKAYGIG